MTCENSARKRSKTMAFRCTPEERKLICEMAAWSGMNRQDYIIAAYCAVFATPFHAPLLQRSMADCHTLTI